MHLGLPFYQQGALGFFWGLGLDQSRVFLLFFTHHSLISYFFSRLKHTFRAIFYIIYCIIVHNIAEKLHNNQKNMNFPELKNFTEIRLSCPVNLQMIMLTPRNIKI